MALALLFARLLLAVVLLIAGIAKLTDWLGTQKALSDFGIPQGLVRLIGRALPISEIVLAVALILRASAWWAAAVTLGLLLVFIAGISVQLIRGHRPACHCFGRLHSATIGVSTIVRNILLALLATTVIYCKGQSSSLSAINWFMAWSPGQQVTFIVAIIALALLTGEGWLLLHTLRHQGQLLLRIENLEHHLAQTPIEEETPGQEQLLYSIGSSRQKEDNSKGIG
ncbi:MauE/DoxX family redox-associated membrane protein [Dictyobacter aurantiacus]|uniref:Methylamine utilisation protein MauE domain-containing protein n=1 Tax=Dictyobacter aurantiacus TaxID=1936993 RepID=A0A401ZP06_9CHLR|nr:MauE/DoxX family redox-associated membrane protein [Dictyobacter aurantiacus]GCE08524.1 hypothetical protein KDAU_58530 [Dictyobacter aurantiacus]